MSRGRTFPTRSSYRVFPVESPYRIFPLPFAFYEPGAPPPFPPPPFVGSLGSCTLSQSYFSIVKGVYSTFDVRISGDSGDPLDLTDYDLQFKVYADAFYKNIVFTKSTLIGSITKMFPLDGLIRVIFGALDTLLFPNMFFTLYWRLIILPSTIVSTGLLDILNT